MKTEEEIKASNKLIDIKEMKTDMGSVMSGIISLREGGFCTCVWGRNEDGFEHVSISPTKVYKMPSWNDMAQLKDIFFYPEEEAYQIMPKKSQYVNLKNNCLHIWRPVNGLTLNDLVQQEEKE